MSNSQRLDLEERWSMDMYRSYKLCCANFPSSQFMNQNKKKLIHRAVSTIFSCTNPSSCVPKLVPGHLPPPVDCRKMSEEATNKSEPVWMQGHVAHASVSTAVTPAHLPVPSAASDPAMSLFPRQMQLGAQPITELKLFMHPKPTMHPHLSQFSYIFQERPPTGKPPAKGETAQVFWVKSDQTPQAMPGVKDKIKEHDLSSSESHEGDSSSLPGLSSGSRPPRPHSAERQYKCKDCGKAFPQPSHLIRHTRTHTGEQPYKCDLCGRAFSDQSHRLRHLRTHIGVRTHKCEECGKEFFEPNHLVRHARRHTGERPFPCDQCGKAFCEQSGLNRHLRTHSGERPFKYPSSPAEGSTSQPSTSTETRKAPAPEEPPPAKAEATWMQGHAPHSSTSISCPPPHFLAPLVAGPDPSTPFFPSQVQLGTQPIAEVKLVMAPKPGMPPHLTPAQLSYMLQDGRIPGKIPGKDPAHLFWVKPDDGRGQSHPIHPTAQDHQSPPSHQSPSNHQSPPSHQSPSNSHQSPPQVPQIHSQDSPSKELPSSKEPLSSTANSCSSRSTDGMSSCVFPLIGFPNL